MVTGFDVKIIEDKEGYGIALVPRDDFKAVSDERLKGEYHGKTFSEVDELGLPEFVKGGKRTWYAKNNGLSRLCLLGNLIVFSDDEVLAGSGGVGRVVVVSAEGTAENLEEKLKE
jgi:hypothetical protein